MKRLKQIARKLKTKEVDPVWDDVKMISRELRKARKEERESGMKVRAEMRERREKKIIENLPSHMDPRKQGSRRKQLRDKKDSSGR